MAHILSQMIRPKPLHLFPLRPLPPPRLLLPMCVCRPSAATSLTERVGSESAAVRFSGWAAPVLRRTSSHYS